MSTDTNASRVRDRFYLEDGIHDAAERSAVGELCYSEYVKTPLVQVLQLLFQQNHNDSKTLHQNLKQALLKSPNPAGSSEGGEAFSVKQN